MLRFTFLVVTLFTCPVSLFAQTTLSAGDIAITGYNTDHSSAPSGNDELKFVLLRSITSGTVIYFTDFGWTDSNAFQDANPCGPSTGAVSDGILQWTATSAMNCGDIVVIYGRTSPTASAGTATGFSATYNDASRYLDMSSGGEQYFAYQGTKASPTLIAGLNADDAWDATLPHCTFNSGQSRLPAALSSNNYAVSVTPETDNGRYDGPIDCGDLATTRANIANSSNWTLDNATPLNLLITLPVEWLDVMARYEKGRTVVSWQTAREMRSSHFEVQRSEDGMAFETLGHVQAAGHSDNLRSYQFVDPRAGTEAFYYRLKQVDLDGQMGYSPIVQVRTPGQAQEVGMVSPNPVQNKQLVFAYHGLAAEWLDFRLTDVAGQLLFTETRQVFGGNQQFLFDLSNLPRSMYVLTVSNGRTTSHHRVSLR